MFTDTHAHLFDPKYKDDLDEVLKRAADAGVDKIIIPATDIATSEKVIELVEKYDFIYGAVGVHPHETKDWTDSIIDRIEKLAKHEKIVAIGEIGLDYFYDFSPKEKQIEAFQAQIDLALKINRPVIIHNRDSDDDMMEIIRSYGSNGLRAQFHCFNGRMEDAKELARMNHFLSFTGNITFKKADSLRNILSSISIEHILLETDSPYLTPEPNRGKRNEPAFVKYVAETIAQIHKLNVEDVARVTSYNVFKFFGIGDKSKASLTYQIGNNLYLNITNRCNAHCTFCDRLGEAEVSGYNLKMSTNEEPGAELYIEQIGDPTKYKEIIFCGYGEPTIRWEVVKEIAKQVKSAGGTTRLNTNGHGNLINKKDITPELKGLIDTVSISLNSGDPRQYSEMMGLDESYFDKMVDFAKSAKNYTGKVVMSIVSIAEVDVERARKVAEEIIGAEFRVRHFF
ncbi:MAG: TatD family hydrolase [Ignavibacteriaceae bacterium]